jgi:hypothetical protein
VQVSELRYDTQFENRHLGIELRVSTSLTPARLSDPYRGFTPVRVVSAGNECIGEALGQGLDGTAVDRDRFEIAPQLSSHICD